MKVSLDMVEKVALLSSPSCSYLKKRCSWDIIYIGEVCFLWRKRRDAYVGSCKRKSTGKYGID